MTPFKHMKPEKRDRSRHYGKLGVLPVGCSRGDDRDAAFAVAWAFLSSIMGGG